MSYESICQDKNIVMHCLTLKCLTICQDKYIVLLCLTFQMNNKKPTGFPVGYNFISILF